MIRFGISSYFKLLSFSYGSQFKLVNIVNAYVNGKSPLKNFVTNVINAGNQIAGSKIVVIKELIGI